MRRILVAIDGSEASLKAVRFSAELARQCGARMTLVYVRPPTLLPAHHYGAVIADIERDHQKFCDELFEAAVKVAQQSGLEPDRLVLTGESTAEAIADAAAAEEVDCVAVGSRGRGAVARMLLGSVADRLVHICQKPVTVVR